MDCKGKIIKEGDIIVYNSCDGTSKGNYYIGIVYYNILYCSFLIQTEYFNDEFTPFLWVKVIDNMKNHKGKSNDEILEMYKDEWKKYDR